MNILITGGTGLIGSSFIRRSSDHTFAVLTRFPDKAKKQLPKEVQCIASLEQLDSLDDFDAVINLGAIVKCGVWRSCSRPLMSLHFFHSIDEANIPYYISKAFKTS